ncbi:MAG: transcriptional repressor LexA [Magnetococcales bacterium]|nr:transcriptional repressor LexA [Magnetococcales bacterium]
MAKGSDKRRGRTPDEGLSPILKNTVETIRSFILKEGIPPTMQELADLLGVSKPTVHEQLGNLERKGYVRRKPRKARSLEIVDHLQHMAELISVPIIGAVAAGVPILAEENRIGEILVESNVARGRCFALVVQGDSMIDAQINPGNLVIVRQQPLAENGEIVVAMLDGEATVKRLFISDDRIALRPANSNYRPIEVGQNDDLKILGKVVGIRAMTGDKNNDLI